MGNDEISRVLLKDSSIRNLFWRLQIPSRKSSSTSITSMYMVMNYVIGIPRRYIIIGVPTRLPDLSDKIVGKEHRFVNERSPKCGSIQTEIGIHYLFCNRVLYFRL